METLIENKQQSDNKAQNELDFASESKSREFRIRHTSRPCRGCGCPAEEKGRKGQYCVNCFARNALTKAENRMNKSKKSKPVDEHIYPRPCRGCECPAEQKGRNGHYCIRCVERRNEDRESQRLIDRLIRALALIKSIADMCELRIGSDEHPRLVKKSGGKTTGDNTLEFIKQFMTLNPSMSNASNA